MRAMGKWHGGTAIRCGLLLLGMVSGGFAEAQELEPASGGNCPAPGLPEVGTVYEDYLSDTYGSAEAPIFSPDGRFVYTSVGDGTIRCFSVDAQSGTLELVHVFVHSDMNLGSWGVDFYLDPPTFSADGRLVFAQYELLDWYTYTAVRGIAVLGRNERTGVLVELATHTFADLGISENAYLGPLSATPDGFRVFAPVSESYRGREGLWAGLVAPETGLIVPEGTFAGASEDFSYDPGNLFHRQTAST